MAVLRRLLLQISVAPFLSQLTRLAGCEGLTAPMSAQASTMNGAATVDYKNPMVRDTVAFISGQSRLGDFISWCNRNRVYLIGKSLIASPALAELLRFNPLTENLNVLKEDTDTCLTSFASMLIYQIRQGGISRVIYFEDNNPQADDDEDTQFKDGLLKACQESNIPIALNEATADIVIQSRRTGDALAADNRVAYLLYNSVAGSSGETPEEELERIHEILEPHVPLTVIYTKPGNAVVEQAKEIVAAIQNRPKSSSIQPMIIASGGDGTVSAVASATLHTGIPFGVIPRGTANAFSVALGIPVDPREACETIHRGETRLVDAAMVNKAPMTLLAGIGFEAGMVESADRSMKNYLGPVAYVLGGAKQLISGEAFNCTLRIDGRESEVEAKSVTVAVVAPATSLMAQGFGEVIPDDGLLDITIETATTVLESLDAMMHLMGAAMVGRPTEAETVLRLRAKEVEVFCPTQSKMVIDGELIDITGPVKFKVLPGALNVIAPPAPEAQ